MKQTEKLDLILRELYKHRYNGNSYPIEGICQTLGIAVSGKYEVLSLAHLLNDKGLINLTLLSQSRVHASLTSYGVQYCEGDSFTFSGHSVITNNYTMNINNSPNSAIVSSSNNVTITITNHGEIKNKIQEIKEAAAGVDSDEIRNNILECLEEINNNIENNKKPKFAFSALITLATGITKVAPLVTELGHLLFPVTQ